MRVKSSARRSDAARPAAGPSTRSVKMGAEQGTQPRARPQDFVSRPPGGSSSGRTTDSDSVYLGSNPSPPANWKGPSHVTGLFHENRRGLPGQHGRHVGPRVLAAVHGPEQGVVHRGDSTGDCTLNAAHPVALLEEAVIPLST